MYDEIQKIIYPNYLTSYEYAMIEELKKDYSEDEIIDAYKTSPIKNIKYVRKVLMGDKRKTIQPEWLNKEIISQRLEKEDIEQFEDFKRFIEEFRK